MCCVTTADDHLLQRLERLEAYAEIQQLVAQYAVSLDGRDIESIVDLYVPDVKVGPPAPGIGHEALREWFYRVVNYWYRSLHHIGGHVITLDDPDHAHGTMQCRVEQEIKDRFITTVVLYDDSYERRDGRWLFAHRHGQPLWCYEHGNDPITTGFESLPGGMPIRLPDEFPRFAEFWTHYSEEQIAAVTHKPITAGGQALDN
jgi:ketosteroid isomerase-like protein